MELKKMATVFGGLMLCIVLAVSAEGRTQYKKVISKIESPTPAEMKVQTAVAENKCNSCHIDKEKKKVRNEYGLALHEALGGDDYKFDKKAWKKNKETKQYSDDVINALRAAINKAAK